MDKSKRKIGYALNMVSTKPDKTGAENIGVAARAGYDYVELPLAELCALDSVFIDQIQRTLQNDQIPCLACNNCLPPYIRIVGPSPDGKLLEDYLCRALPILRMLGVQSVVFGSGRSRQIPDGFDRAKGFEQIVSALKKIALRFADIGVCLAIEPLCPQECNIINTFEEGRLLSDAVGEKNVRVLVDYYHMLRQGESLESLKRYGHLYLQHVHVAYGDDKRCPLEAGEISDFMLALDEISYCGTVSVESYSQNFNADCQRALSVVREFC